MTSKKNWKQSLLGSVCAFAVITPQVLAQDDITEIPELEEITVTGSRIVRTSPDTLFPTVGIDAGQIDNRGFYSLGEAIADIPLFSSTGNSDTDFNQSSVDLGLSFVDLFGLGSQRTLTLVNGKRVVSSSSPQPDRSTGSSGLQVDLNTIPTALIDRVEVVTVGGAPVYGADAIAGTVNVILKDDFEGLDLDVQGGMSGSSDAENVRARATYGLNFDDEKGNIVFSVEYSKRNGLRQTDRPGANSLQLTDPAINSDPGFFSNNNPINIFVEDSAILGASQFGSPVITALTGGTTVQVIDGFGVVGGPQNANGDLLMFDASGELITVPVGDGNGTSVLTHNQADFPGIYRERDFTSMLNESERYVISSLGKYDFSDNVTGTFRFNYSKLDASQPVSTPLVAGFGVPIIPLSSSNPFLSQTARTELSAATNFGLPFFASGPRGLGRALTEFGTEGNRSDVENWSLSAGVEGEFEAGDRSFNWDVTYSYGKNNAVNTSPNGAVANAFTLAIDPVLVDATDTIVTDVAAYNDISTFSFDASAGGYTGPDGQRIVCRSFITGASGGANCLPFNPFGNQNPEAVIASLAAQSQLFTNIEQQFVQANIGGGLFDLPAGEVAFALGIEYRREEASFEADTLTTQGALLEQVAPISPISGNFESRELYLETLIPVVGDETLGTDFGFRLDLEGAARLIDNNRTGSDWVWTIGGRMYFGDNVIIRGNVTKSVRSPGIGELFSGDVNVNASLSDPCRSAFVNSGPVPETRLSNCVDGVLAAGLAADAAEAETFLSTFGFFSLTPGVVSGNPDLENETANAWTIGLVLQPETIPGLTVTADWNDIRIDNTIVNLSGAQVLTSCYDISINIASNPFCDQFTRDASFNLTSFEAGWTNQGFVDFAGFTGSLTYNFSVSGLIETADAPGSITLRGVWNHLSRYQTSSDGLLILENDGVLGREKNRAQMSISYNGGGFGITWETNYRSGGFIDIGEKSAVENGTKPVFEFNEFNATWVHDLALTYDINEDISARFIVNNITKFNQPRELRQLASVQSRIGRSFLVGLSARF